MTRTCDECGAAWAGDLPGCDCYDADPAIAAARRERALAECEKSYDLWRRRGAEIQALDAWLWQLSVVINDRSARDEVWTPEMQAAEFRRNCGFHGERG